MGRYDIWVEMADYIRMVFCDSSGRIYDHPALVVAGLDGPEPEPIPPERMIPVPRGSDLMMLPARRPVGVDPAAGKTVALARWKGSDIFAASVFMAPGYTQTFRAAYLTDAGAPSLPLYAYTALGWRRGQFYAAGVKVDDDPRQNPWLFDEEEIGKKVARARAAAPTNRLLAQLERCALGYRCRAAQNFFLGRWEAPLPVSTVCNARCVGCLSLQKDGTFKASHDRLQEPPSAEEVAEVALMHLEAVRGGVVSFGQGCEGEPLLMADLLAEVVAKIRGRTCRGTINLNTNGSLPSAVSRLIEAGLDSIRVSVNSFRAPLYRAYYRPRRYELNDVIETISLAAERRCFVSVNLLVFPGVTDTGAELEALAPHLSAISMIQMRNLNIDPELYIKCLPPGAVGRGMGMVIFMEKLKKLQPGLRFGYFNPVVAGG